MSETGRGGRPTLAELIDDKRDRLDAYEQRGERDDPQYPEVTDEEARAIHDAFDRLGWGKRSRIYHPMVSAEDDDDVDGDLKPLCHEIDGGRGSDGWNRGRSDAIPVGWKDGICRMCGVAAAERGVIDRD